LLVIIAGIYFVINNQSSSATTSSSTSTVASSSTTSSQSTTSSTTTTPTPTSTQNAIYPLETRYANKQILLLVDNTTYQQLESRLLRYAADVKTDIGANVTIIHGTWSSPAQIRSVIQGYYASGNLLGSILVGSIPAPYIKYGNHTTSSESNSTGTYVSTIPAPIFLSDWYYEDMNDTFVPVSGTDNTFSIPGFEGASYRNHRNIWSSRIVAPVGGQEGITLLENYFDKDHAYRGGQLSYSGAFYTNPAENYSGSSFQANFGNFGANLGLKGSTTLLYISNPATQKQSVLNAISQPNLLAVLNVHGTPTLEWLGGETFITSQNVTNSKSNSLFTMLESCSNGNYSVQNYIAGSYLFYGNTLVVSGTSTPTYFIGSTNPSTFNYLKPLAQGIIVGEAWLADGGGVSGLLFGDPALSLVQAGAYPKTYSNAVLSPGSVNFGTYTEEQINNSPTLFGNSTERTVKVKTINVTVKNTGNATLVINYTPGSSYQISGIPVFEALDKNYEGFVSFSIQPGQTIQIPIAFVPYTGTSPGNYKEIVTYTTSDPGNPYLSFILNATITK
ncbi:MAG: hypothetical protein ACHQX1_03045, partial [Candidatus Micrarchaeales archaeon]